MFRVISYLLAVAVFTTPWFIGGNWPFTRFILVGAGAVGLFAIFVTLLGRFFSKDATGFVLPAIWVFCFAGLLMTAFQASDASSWLQASVGAANPPVSVHQTTDNVFEPVTEMATNSAKRPISVYPAATREKLVDLVLAIGVFLIATVVLNRPDRLMPLIVALAISGVAVSFVGILQKLSSNGKVLWQYELLGGGAPLGPFVNGNNAAGFLLISFSAAMFFVAYRTSLWQSDPVEKLSLDGAGWEASDKRGIFAGLIEAVARLESRHLYFLAALTIIAAGICLSLSRGGMIALACSGMLGCFLIAKSNRFAGILLTLAILAGGIGLVSYTDKSGRVVKELDSLGDLSTAASTRVQHWLDALPFAKNNWLLGCGNGTYRIVSPSFDSFFSTRTFAHAESIYVETLIEMGVGGLLLLIAILGYCFVTSIKLMRRRESFDRALGVTGILCLVGQALAAALDFGIYQPANAIAMAALMGGIVGRATHVSSKTFASEEETTNEQAPFKNKSPFLKLASLGLLLFAALASGWATYESYGVESRRAGTRAVRLFNELQKRGQRAPSLNTLNLAENQLKTTIQIRSDDYYANYYLGELSTMRYRHLQAEQIVSDIETQIEELEKLKAFSENETTTEVMTRREQIDEQQEIMRSVNYSQIWNSTDPLFLHQAFRRAERIDPNYLQVSKASDGVKELLQPAWRYYKLAEDICPRLPKTQLRLAELGVFIPEPAAKEPNSNRLSEDERIKLALSRANANTQLLFDCGFLALNSGNQPEAVRLWAKCLAFPHRKNSEKAIIELCQAELPMRLFFEEVLPQDPQDLIYYMQKYFEPTERSIPMQLLANHTATVITQQTEPNSLEQFWLLAEVALLNQDYEEATKNYAKVEKFSSDDVAASFRFHYALSLFHTKQYDEAMRNVKICELNRYEPRKVKRLFRQIQRKRTSNLKLQSG